MPQEKTYASTASYFMKNADNRPRSGSLKRKNDSPPQQRKAPRLNVGAIRQDVEDFESRLSNCQWKGNAQENFKKLYSAFSVMSTVVLKLVDEVEYLREESETSNTNYAKVAAASSKLQKDNARLGLGRELEESDRTAKILDLGFTCKVDEISDMPKKIRETFSEDTEANNWLHDSVISPMFPEGKPNKADKEKDLKVGCLIKCKSSDSKKNLCDALSKLDQGYAFRYHFPQKLMSYVNRIRKDFKEIKATGVDFSTAHLLIRPNRNYSGLALKYRKVASDKWTFIGNVELMSDIPKEDEDVEIVLPHQELFSKFFQ